MTAPGRSFEARVQARRSRYQRPSTMLAMLTASHALPLATPHPAMALAVSGGRPVTCFGEWVPSGFLPLTVVTDGEVVACA